MKSSDPLRHRVEIIDVPITSSFQTRKKEKNIKLTITRALFGQIDQVNLSLLAKRRTEFPLLSSVLFAGFTLRSLVVRKAGVLSNIVALGEFLVIVFTEAKDEAPSSDTLRFHIGGSLRAKKPTLTADITCQRQVVGIPKRLQLENLPSTRRDVRNLFILAEMLGAEVP